MLLYNQRLIKKGFHDVNAVLSEVRAWCDDNEYVLVETRNVTKEKDKGIEVKIDMTAFHDSDDYFRHVLELDFLIVKIKKVKSADAVAERGEFEVSLVAKLAMDYKNSYHSKIAEFMMKFKEDFLLHARIDENNEQVYKEAQELLETMKRVLALP